MSLMMASSPYPPPVHTAAATTPLTSRPTLPRRSSSMHKQMIARLRPLPLQYVWSLWHTKPSVDSTTASYTLTELADSVPDIATFYRIYNNVPWDNIRLKDSLHFFRTGVKPLWEDPENVDGGCLVIKVRREDGRATRVWEEICLMCCGGEVQAALTSERDHVLGISFSLRLYWAHISIWTKKGSNWDSVELLQQAVMTGLSPGLRPKSNSEYYYKKHSDHEGWKEALQKS